MVRSPINQMVCGLKSPKKCWWQLQRAGILYSEEQVLHPEDHWKAKVVGKTSIHYNAEPTTAELLLRIIVSVNQLIVYGAVAGSCHDLAQRIKALSPPSTGTPVVNVNNDPASQVPSEDVANLTKAPIWNSGAPRELGASTWREIRKSSRRLSINESLRRCWF